MTTFAPDPDLALVRDGCHMGPARLRCNKNRQPVGRQFSSFTRDGTIHRLGEFVRLRSGTVGRINKIEEEVTGFVEVHIQKMLQANVIRQWIHGISNEPNERFWNETPTGGWDCMQIIPLKDVSLKSAEVISYDEYQSRKRDGSAPMQERLYFVRQEWKPETLKLEPFDTDRIKLKLDTGMIELMRQEIVSMSSSHIPNHLPSSNPSNIIRSSVDLLSSPVTPAAASSSSASASTNVPAAAASSVSMNHVNDAKVWSSADDSLLRQQYEEFKDIPSYMDILQSFFLRSVNSIKTRLKTLGIVKNKPVSTAHHGGRMKQSFTDVLNRHGLFTKVPPINEIREEIRKIIERLVQKDCQCSVTMMLDRIKDARDYRRSIADDISLSKPHAFVAKEGDGFDPDALEPFCDLFQIIGFPELDDTILADEVENGWTIPVYFTSSSLTEIVDVIESAMNADPSQFEAAALPPAAVASSSSYIPSIVPPLATSSSVNIANRSNVWDSFDDSALRSLLSQFEAIYGSIIGIQRLRAGTFASMPQLEYVRSRHTDQEIRDRLIQLYRDNADEPIKSLTIELENCKKQLQANEATSKQEMESLQTQLASNISSTKSLQLKYNLLLPERNRLMIEKTKSEEMNQQLQSQLASLQSRLTATEMERNELKAQLIRVQDTADLMGERVILVKHEKIELNESKMELEVQMEHTQSQKRKAEADLEEANSRHQQRQVEHQKRLIEAAAERERIADELENEKKLCVCCISTPPTLRYAPCGHVVCCEGCDAALPKPRTCPKCRIKITGKPQTVIL